MRSRITRRADADEGAVAILTAMLALVLFAFAAVAVELGDMYSRDAAVQTTADLAAFAGAQRLPDACGAFNVARASLNNNRNGVFSDTEATSFGAGAGVLSDGDLTNGEIEILDWDNQPLPDPTATPCSDAGRRVKVTTPTRTINFPFAGGLPGAPDSGTVQGTASVELRSLDQLSVLPFSLPSSCGLGSQTLYERSGINPPPSGSIAYQPPGRLQGPHVVDVVPDSAQSPLPPAMTIEVSLTRLRVDPSVVPGPDVEFDFHLLQEGAPPLREPPAGGVVGTLIAGSVQPNVTNPAWFDAWFTVALPATVSTTPGDWKIRGRQLSPGSDFYTRDSRVGTFTVIPPVVTSCIPTDEPSGVLASPRAEGGTARTMLAKNLIGGIDHDLFAVANSVTDQPCDADGVPYTDGRLDDSLPTTGATCIDVRFPDASDTSPADGLVNGAAGLNGRLDVLNGVPDLPSSPGPDCRVANDGDMRWTKDGHDLVDTALSCYLTPSKSLANVKAGQAGSLSEKILTDPRFFVFPRTDTSFRIANAGGPSSAPAFWPIKDLVGGFLTNETVAGGDATCSNDDDCNGLVFNSGSQLDSVQAFVFPLSAIEDTHEARLLNGRPYIGGPKDLLLVE